MLLATHIEVQSEYFIKSSGSKPKISEDQSQLFAALISLRGGGATYDVVVSDAMQGGRARDGGARD